MRGLELGRLAATMRLVSLLVLGATTGAAFEPCDLAACTCASVPPCVRERAMYMYANVAGRN